MIAYLRGIVRMKKPDHAVVDVGGVGYSLLIPLSTYYKLDDAGGEREFHVHTHVREDQITLFGFASAGELDLFRALVSVHGFGPKTALTALSGMDPESLARCILTSDTASLCRIPGIGKKTAERLVYELKDKLPRFLDAGAARPGPHAVNASDPLSDDLVSAMVNLGYAKPTAEKAVAAAVRDAGGGAPFEALLKSTLRLLMDK